MSSEADENLLKDMFSRATGTNSENIDEFAVCMFCTLVRNNLNFVEKSAELFVNKINQVVWNPVLIAQSLRALDLLEECMSKCGTSFQMEISKFRFLNKLIELVSIKHRGEKTPKEIRDKIMDCFLLWTAQYPEKEKIKSAYDMLRSQGIQHTPAPIPNNTTTSKRVSFMNDENEQKLKKLLQSTNPEDFKRANLFIQYHVSQDAKKMERIMRQKAELKEAQDAITLFNQVLDNYIEEGITNNDSCDVIKDIYESCLRYKNIINKMPEIMEDSEQELFGETIEVNDNLLASIEKYNKVFNNDDNSAHVLPSNADQNVDDLLSGFLEKDLQPKTNSTVEIKKNSLDELHDIFTSKSVLDDSNGNGLKENIMTTFNILEPLPVVNEKIFVTNNSSIEKMSNLTPEVKSSLSTIDTISEELFKENLKTNERIRKFKKEPVKITLNELAKDNININTDKISDLESDNLTVYSADSLHSGQSNLNTATTKEPNKCSEDEEIISETPKKEVTEGLMKSLTENMNRTCNGKILHLSEIAINLNEVAPSSIDPRIIMDEPRGLKIILNFAVDKPAENVSVIVITSINQSTFPIDDYQFDASVRKPCKLRLLEPTGCSLPGVKPFRPPSNDLQQIMLLLNPTKVQVDITCIISYKLGTDPDPIKESVTVESIPYFE